MASAMAKPSVSVPDELLDDFDDEIIRRKFEGDLPKKTSRSDVMRALMEEWIQGNVIPPSTGRRTSAAVAPIAD